MFHELVEVIRFTNIFEAFSDEVSKLQWAEPLARALVDHDEEAAIQWGKEQGQPGQQEMEGDYSS